MGFFQEQNCVESEKNCESFPPDSLLNKLPNELPEGVDPTKKEVCVCVYLNRYLWEYNLKPQPYSVRILLTSLPSFNWLWGISLAFTVGVRFRVNNLFVMGWIRGQQGIMTVSLLTKKKLILGSVVKVGERLGESMGSPLS